MLRAAIILNVDAGGMAMHEAFERLHTAGGPAGPQEARSCLLAGGLADALLEMNRDKDWRDVVGPPFSIRGCGTSRGCFAAWRCPARAPATSRR